MSWKIDPAHSLIEFSVTHMMISKVKGRFNDFSGIVELNLDEPEKTSVEAEVEVTSIDTRQQQRDDHLRSPDFFNVSEFPTMKFYGTKVKRVDDKHAELIGELTIKTITRPVTLSVVFNGLSKSPWGETSAGFSASTILNRKDWELTWNQTLETGGVLVSDEITVNIEIELIKQES